MPTRISSTAAMHAADAERGLLAIAWPGCAPPPSFGVLGEVSIAGLARHRRRAGYRTPSVSRARPQRMSVSLTSVRSNPKRRIVSIRITAPATITSPRPAP